MTEEQPYTVTASYDGFEVRHYPDYILVQVEVTGGFMRAGNVAFGPLVSFISGNNVGGKKYTMTAPVIQEPTREDTHTVSFVLPAGMTISDVPLPTNSQVKVRHVAAHDAAAMKFGGGWSEDRFDSQGKLLVQAVHRAGLHPVGNLYFARYDPPWKPWFLKRNEVLIALESSEK